ncbi:MAG: hypothetical protein HQK79_14185 [Desulfobacterales bacterium]|nr:hypothetical protein [Desulfobacterales bacterium]
MNNNFLKHILLVFLVFAVAFQPYVLVAGTQDRFSKIELTTNNYAEFPQISAPTGNPKSNTGWLYVKDNAGTTNIYFEDDGGTVTNLMSPTVSTAWDDLGAPDANKTLSFGTYTSMMTGAGTAADQFTYRGTGDFGDVSIFKVQQATGNPTDGTVFEIDQTDTDCDPFLVTVGGVQKVLMSPDGSITSAGTVTGANLVVSGTATIGTLSQNAVTAATTNQTLALNGNGVGGVNIGSVSTGGVTLGASTTVADGKDVTIGEGSLTIDNDQTTETALTITSDATTSGGGINVTSAVTTTNGKAISVTADGVTTGDVVYLNSSAAGMTTGNFINCYDGAASIWKVGLYGATTIAGNAATDIMTITAGNLQMTAGNIDVDEGKIEVDTAIDQTSYVKRNQGTTTSPVFEIEETNTAADNPALLIDQKATAAGSYGLEIQSGGGNAINLTDLAATGDGLVVSTANSYTGQIFKVSDTLVGTSGEGIVDIHTTANQATGSTLMRLDSDTGTLAGATDGFLLNIDDDSGAQATSYAVKIDSASNEALHVATGKALFDEKPTFTSGIEANGASEFQFDGNTETMTVTAATNAYAAGSAMIYVYNAAATGQTNSTYLLRLAYKADGDAQDNFILCQDNSTGALGNGDEMFKVDATGATTIAGILTANGDIVGDGGDQLTGFLHTLVNDADGDTLAITESGTVETNASAVGGGIYNLPEASTAIGMEFTLVVMASQNMDINPDDGDKILGLTDASGDAVRNSTVGNTLTLIAVDATNWVVKSNYGTWTDVN